MGRRRWLQHTVETLLVGVIGREQRREHGDERDGRDHDQPGDAQAVADEGACERSEAPALVAARAHLTRTRGSKTPYATSTARLARSTVTAVALSVPWITGKSLGKRASTPIRPRPGSANTYSTMNEPAMNWPHASPITVTTGMTAGRAACLLTTTGSARPLARAV